MSYLKLGASYAFRLVAYPSRCHEILFDSQTRLFTALRGVPRRGIFDDMCTAVDKVHKGKGRTVNVRLLAMCALYPYDPVLCNGA